MKCPKCGYLGFEPVDRCRNCGYDFALMSPDADFELELPLRREAGEPQPLDDLAFLDEVMAPEPGAAARDAAAPSRGAAPVTPELPLFESSAPDDVPLITKPSPPRSPLAVRRSTPEVPRVRSTPPRLASLELGLEPPSEPPPNAALRGEVGDESGNATVAARLAAVLTDLVILVGVDVAVVYFTLKICGIGISDLGILPRVPLFVFLLVQNGGYLVAFTAGGQTLGKMVAGIKVVAADPGETLNFGRAFIRELIWLGLAVPAGLGLLSVLSHDRRGVHDRFAGTRVVRV